MKEEIKQELKNISGCMAGTQIPMPYAVPDEYFANFEKNLRSKITEEDATTAVHTLAGKTMPYSVPGDYFDKLPKLLLEKNEAEKQKGIRITFPQLRWAAAAIVLIAISVGTYNLYRPSADTIKPGKVMLASVNNNDIQEYLANAAGTNVINVSGEYYLDKIESKDIVSYLDQTGWDTEYY